ncbi:trypsin-like peptidase domain-containing protein [Luteolibacter arcticus]|uniref:Trypsin-like peptidase domain-containing protein n=1 Tax=Luteolibacter arcticus TaxID=1581411 RepID=A0ABT3GBW6_9BACT|nr:trypsin-like peptidase domain-containing protein [Luteolibacter arcticus]MCW1921116.1 trypsin-like peptidase domain-containing protein [Luteolibacter arcticus]
MFHPKPIILLGLALVATAAESPRLPADQAAGLCQVDASPAPAVEAPRQASFAPLLEKVTPSVVSIFPAMILSDPTAAGPLERFFGKEGEAGSESEGPQEKITSMGSGVILSSDGWIVTNSHVVHLQNGKIADTFFVELHDHRRFHATIAGADPATDLALLKIDAKDLSPLKFADSEQVKAGDLVFAVGNPFQVGMTCTMGMVSATRRSNLGIGGSSAFESYIQTDAAINPGNSGGALIDASGRLIGINTAIWGGIGGNVGIGFAIPSNLVRHIVARLAEEGKVTRGFFGISSTGVDDKKAGKVKLPKVAGAAVEAIMEDSPAGSAGLKAGDIVVKAAGKPVISRGDLRFELSLVKPGDSIELVYWRDGAEHTATLVSSAEPMKAAKLGDARVDKLPGVSFRVSDGEVAVVEVTSTEAKRAGLEPGMVIVSVNGTEVTDLASLESSLRNGVNKVKTLLNRIENTLALRAE